MSSAAPSEMSRPGSGMSDCPSERHGSAVRHAAGWHTRPVNWVAVSASSSPLRARCGPVPRCPLRRDPLLLLSALPVHKNPCGPEASGSTRDALLLPCRACRTSWLHLFAPSRSTIRVSSSRVRSQSRSRTGTAAPQAGGSQSVRRTAVHDRVPDGVHLSQTPSAARCSLPRLRDSPHRSGQ